MKKYLLSIFVGLVCSAASAVEPDMIVTQAGETIKVYNLEISPTSVFYTLTEDPNGDLKKIANDRILIIKKADGTKIDPMASSIPESNKKTVTKNPAAHPPVTHKAIEDDFVYLKLDKFKIGDIKVDEIEGYFIQAADENGQILNYRLNSKDQKTLSVARSRLREETNKKGEVKKHKTYYSGEYVIPEYVQVGDDKYTVVSIDAHAFEGNPDVTNVVFPSTLESIGDRAFAGIFGGFSAKPNNLRSVILPEGLKQVGSGAFWRGSENIIDQLYIPKSLENIGEWAFMYLGKNTSYRGYFQGNLTCMPDFVNILNCKDYGIDEEAVEVYEQKNK